MIDVAAVVLPLTLGVVLIASGIGKLRRPDTVEGWADLGVPAVLRQRWIIRVQPVGELALGAALIGFGGWIGETASIVAVSLMGAYTVLVVRARSRPDPAECGCFGAPEPVTALTVARNVWLLAIAVGSAATVWSSPLIGGALTRISGPQWWWAAGAGVVAITVALVLWPSGRSRSSRHRDGVEADADYIRVRTPAVPVTLGDGSSANLRELTASRPLLLLALAEDCSGCDLVHERIPRYRTELPELDVRIYSRDTPEISSLTESGAPPSLHDPDGLVRASIADWEAPTAVLFGADGLIAGGPVYGAAVIDGFVAEVRASLHPENPD